MLPKVGLSGVGIFLNLVIVSIPLLIVSDRSYMHSPAIWAFYLLISVFCLAEIWAGTSEITQTAGTMPYLPHIVGLTLLMLIWVSVYEVNGHTGWPALGLGSLLIIIGISARTVSILALNTRFLSQIRLQPNHSLNKTGIYAIIRHPSELGLLLIGLGIPTLFSSTTGLYVYAGLFVPLSLYRIWLEDNLLSEAFTHEFSIYKSTTPALFPKLYPTR